MATIDLSSSSEISLVCPCPIRTLSMYRAHAIVTRSVTFGLPPPSTAVDDRNITLPAKVWYGRGTSMQPVNAAFASRNEECKWIQDEAVDPAGIIRPQEYLAAFWIKSTSVKKEPQQGGIEVVMYLVGGGYITGQMLPQVPGQTAAYA